MTASRTTHTSTSSGSSETDVKELAVMPWPKPPARAVSTVIPVANMPTASRYWRLSGPVGMRPS
jgi:hypothetical protein